MTMYKVENIFIMLPKHIVRPVPCPATNFKTTVDIYVLTEYKLVYINILYIYNNERKGRTQEP